MNTSYWVVVTINCPEWSLQLQIKLTWAELISWNGNSWLEIWILQDPRVSQMLLMCYKKDDWSRLVHQSRLSFYLDQLELSCEELSLEPGFECLDASEMLGCFRSRARSSIDDFYAFFRWLSSTKSLIPSRFLPFWLNLDIHKRPCFSVNWIFFNSTIYRWPTI